MLRLRTKLFFIGCLIGLIVFSAEAANCQIIGAEKMFGRYQQFVWQDQHGLPQNGISKIVQTPDGYLWLAIAEGVARFDGVRFTAFDTGNTPEIKSNNVQTLLVDSKGMLWIGTHGGGLTSYQDGFFRHYSADQGLSAPHVRSLFEDRTGNLWVGTDGGGLNILRGGKFTAYTTENGLPDNRIGAIAEDTEGNLWIGTSKGLVRMKDEKITVFTSKDGLAGDNFRAIFLDRDGVLWFGGEGGLSLYKDREFSTFGEKDGVRADNIWSIAQDRDGTIWFGAMGNGVYRYKDGIFQSQNKQNGLINNDIQAVFLDPSGNVWLGTNGSGLIQLKTGRFSVFTTTEGLPDNIVSAIFEDSAGGVWVGTEEGLSRFKDGKFTEIKTTDGQSIKGVGGIDQDRDGNLMFLSSSRQTGNIVAKFKEESGVVESVGGKEFINRASTTLQDKSGNMWFGTNYEGLHLVKTDGNETIFRKSNGLADDYISVLFEDRAGNIWVGTRGGLSRFKDGNLTTFKKSEGFTENLVLSMHEDGRGNLWIGTDGDGLFRFRDGKFDVFTSKNGLYDNLAFAILEDGKGNLWMSGNKGIYRANIIELEEFAEGRRASVNSFSYGSADGMLSRECNGANPAGAVTRDGQLWFPTVKGVVVVNPNNLDTNPPIVSIEQVLIDRQILPVGQPLEMSPGQENLEIQFSALSWNRPAQIRFKYQLVGLDADWVEAGTRRTAYYPHITPGEYTFRVIADNGEGIWNDVGKTLRVVVLPPFYKTWWFLILCGLFVALIIRLMYGYRLAQLQKINEARAAFTQKLIEYQESERQRIAVELHDSIGQSLIVIRNRALMSLNAPEKHDRILAQMEEISDSAADSIKEVRQIAHNLHPYQLEHLGLKTALETMIGHASASSDIEFSTEIEDVDETLSKEAEINFYRIVQESVNNILKHSEATEADIKILRNNGNLNLTIRDNGKGFALEQTAKNKRGLGLSGIGERAKILGARYEIQSAEGKGTTVSLTLDL